MCIFLLDVFPSNTSIMTPQLQKKIDFAIHLLQAFDNPDQPVEIAYSGGKDSDVILQLAKEAGINYRAIYRNTTIDPPGTIKHAQEMGCEILQPRRYTFRQLIAKRGLPSRFRRFCCEELKEYKVSDKCVMGVRKAESRARMERYQEPTQCRFYGSKKEHVEAIYPILEWTDEDVVEFLTDRKIKVHALYYREDGTIDPKRRLGCMCCPLASTKHRIEEFKKYPGMVKLYRKAYQEFLDTHPNCSAAKRHADADEGLVHDIFFPGSREWDMVSDGLFGKPDFKGFLEKQFGITL